MVFVSFLFTILSDAFLYSTRINYVYCPLDFLWYVLLISTGTYCVYQEANAYITQPDTF